MRGLAHRWTIRARLTALTAVLVLAAGTVVVVGGWWWLTSSLPEAAVAVSDGGVYVTVQDAAPIQVGSEPGVLGKVPDELLGSSDAPVGSAVRAASVDLASEAVRVASQNLTAEVARRAGLQSAVLLGLLTVVAVGIGWFAARRALAPVHAMTDTARSIGAGRLDVRLPVTGPHDEVRELGETFNDLLDRVEDSVAREQRLLANVSHELRTPLANQRIVLELALEQTVDDDEPLLRAARTALDQNLRAHRLIEQLLLLARIEQSEAGGLDAADVELLPLVEGLASQPALAALGPRGVRVEVLRGDSAAVVRGEPVLVERLIGNVLENAVRHNVPGGAVTVEVLDDDLRPEVLVSNTGPVVEAGEVSSLFLPFRRAAATGGSDRMRSQDGAGLGLSVVDAVARRYGVDVTALPRSGGGLDVRLRWPRTTSTGTPATKR